MDDPISRQAAIDALHMHLMYRLGTDSNKKRLDDWINNLPSAQPQRKKGKWIEEETFDAYDIEGVKSWAVFYKCDQCGFKTYAIQRHFGQYKFCPSCGADMRGEEEWADKTSCSK